MRTRTLASATALAGMITMITVPSAAQETQPAAQPAGQHHRGLDEVVVTASRRREESVQDIPIAVTALSDVTLEKQNIIRIEEIDDIVPNLVMSETARVNNSRIAIRGIGGGNTTQLFSSGVGLYVDGVYVANSIGAYSSVFELERVEVLRGPQGTLFGKNTTGGLVNVVSKKPGPIPETNVMLGFGRFNEMQGKISVNQPLVEDKLFARIGVGYVSDDGYMKELNTGDGYSDNQNRSLRAAIRWLPNEHWTADFIGTYVDEPRKATGGKCVYLGDTTNNGPRHDSGGGDAFGGDVATACTQTQNAAKDEFYSDVEGFGHVTVKSLTGSARWDSAGPKMGFENVSVTATAGFRATHQEYSVDADYSSADYMVRLTEPNGGGTTAEGRSFELLLDTTSFDGRLNALAGYYFFEDSVVVDGSDCIALYDTVRGTGETVECYQPGYTSFRSIPFNTTGGGSAPYAKAQTPHERPSHSVFFHANYALTPRLKWDVGARYTYEKLKMRSMDWTSTRTPAGFKHYISDDTVDLLVEGVRSWDAVTPMTSLTYGFDGVGALESGILYGSVSTGFLSGGINNEIDLEVFGDFGVFDPEHVTAYEVGLKTNWNRARANLAVFYTDYKDKQEVIDIDNSAGIFPGDPAISVFDNAAALEIYGFELETTFNPVDNLNLILNVGYLHNRYKDFPTFDFLTGTVIDQSDVVVADFSPPWSGNASVSYDFDLAGGSLLTPRIGIYYQDAYLTNETSNVNVRPGGLCYQGDYAKVDARVTWENSAGDMQIAAWGTNLTDEDIFRACAVSSGNGYMTYSLEPPARYGIQLTKRW